jgi:hypothetical protein
MDARLRGFVPEIDDDEIALIVLHPAPGEEILAALVVGPAAPLTQMQFTVPKDITIDLFQQAPVTFTFARASTYEIMNIYTVKMAAVFMTSTSWAEQPPLMPPEE